MAETKKTTATVEAATSSKGAHKQVTRQIQFYS